MGVIRKILGPKSKYDKSLPYTYMAESPVIEGDEELFSYYFADTICGLVEYLDKNDIKPEEVKLFSLYKSKEIELEKELCTDENGEWLQVPHICSVLEDHYSRTGNELYKGHIEKHECSFEDRDRQGIGAH